MAHDLELVKNRIKTFKGFAVLATTSKKDDGQGWRVLGVYTDKVRRKAAEKASKRLLKFSNPRSEKGLTAFSEAKEVLITVIDRKDLTE